MIANKPAIDAKKYARLLAKALPTMIETEEAYERLHALVEPMFDKGENLTPEEGALFDLLVHLIQEYEEKHYPIPDAGPVEVLRFLMEQRELKPADLADVMGGRSRVSDVLNGKREISKEQAKKLAEFFNVSVELFI